jgi:hypothetical protein
VSGPDGVAVALWYAGTGEYRVPLVVPYTLWPGSPPGRLAALLDQYIRVMNRVMPASPPGFVVQAHATSGPPAAVIRYFQHKGDAAAFAAGSGHLAEVQVSARSVRVRAASVDRLRTGWPPRTRPCGPVVP